MATLNNMPCELLTEIFSYLPSADLARTCLVSRSVCNISTPVLYKSPVLRDSGLHQSLKMFLLTLLTPGQESLATHVRSLRWTWLRIPYELCPRDEALLAPAATRFGLRPFLNKQGSQFVLLIHLLPRLRTLHITPPGQGSSFTEFIDWGPTAQNALRPLQSLQEFRTTPVRKRDGVTQKTLMALLTLPCIRLIDVGIALSESLSRLRLATPVASSTLTHLRIRDANAAPAYLGPVLTATAQLTHFSYTMGCHRTSFTLAEFWEYLRPVAATVVNLHLELRLRVMPGHERSRGVVQGEAMWSFKQWTALRTLKCTAAAVMGRETGRAVGKLAQVLPRGLRELDVREDENCAYVVLVDEVVEALARMDAVVPCLERVAVRPASSLHDMASLERLRGACEVAGVAVVKELPKWDACYDSGMSCASCKW